MYNLYICTLGNVQDRPSTVAALVDWCVEWELSARVTPVSNQPIGGKMHKMRLRMQTLHGANAPLCVFRYHFPYHTTSEKPTTTSIQTVKQQQQQQHPHCSQIHAILQCMHKKALDLSPPPASSWVQFLWHLHRMRWLRYKRENIHRYVNATTLSSSYRCSWLLSLHSYVAASTYIYTHTPTNTHTNSQKCLSRRITIWICWWVHESKSASLWVPVIPCCTLTFDAHACQCILVRIDSREKG